MLVDIETLKLWPGNYNEGDVSAIVRSIRRFGFVGTLRVWQNNELRGGNHSLMALLDIKRHGAIPELDLQYPPKGVVVKKNNWFVECNDVSYLTETEALAFAIADNRTAALATQNDELLVSYLEHLNDISSDYPLIIGYDDDDVDLLKQILNGNYDHSDESHASSTDASPVALSAQYMILIECPNEIQQSELLQRFNSEGLKCRALVS